MKKSYKTYVNLALDLYKSNYFTRTKTTDSSIRTLMKTNKTQELDLRFSYDNLIKATYRYEGHETSCNDLMLTEEIKAHEVTYFL